MVHKIQAEPEKWELPSPLRMKSHVIGIGLSRYGVYRLICYAQDKNQRKESECCFHFNEKDYNFQPVLQNKQQFHAYFILISDHVLCSELYQGFTCLFGSFWSLIHGLFLQYSRFVLIWTLKLYTEIYTYIFGTFRSEIGGFTVIFTVKSSVWQAYSVDIYSLSYS